MRAPAAAWEERSLVARMVAPSVKRNSLKNAMVSGVVSRRQPGSGSSAMRMSRPCCVARRAQWATESVRASMMSGMSEGEFIHSFQEPGTVEIVAVAPVGMRLARRVATWFV
jgi:hypothetical protein